MWDNGTLKERRDIQTLIGGTKGRRLGDLRIDKT
jgi:hypothetical protein